MFEYAVQKARELAEDYKLFVLNGHSTRKCEKEFLWRSGDLLNLEIRVHYLPVTLAPGAMSGTYIRGADSVDILLRQSMPPAWERFVLVKEVFHAVLDSEPFQNPNVMEHLEKTLFGEIPTGGTMPLHAVSEYAAHAAAAEFLFPWKDRKAILNDKKQEAKDNIASEYGVPPTVVEHYLTSSAMKFYEFP